MKIRTIDGYKDFDTIARKMTDLIEVNFEGKLIKCSIDHVFRRGNQEIRANLLPYKYLGEEYVYTPVNVEGGFYLANGIEHHNCSFLGSSSTLISGDILSALEPTMPTSYKYVYDMQIYEDPIPGAMYFMGVDSAGGNSGDYSCIQVLKYTLSEDLLEQVAMYRNNTIRPENYADVVDEVNKFYNNCMMIVENNDVGRIICNKLWYEKENFNIINTEKTDIGTKADRKSKLDACMNLKERVETKKLVLHDNFTISELRKFEEKSPNVFGAHKGEHDDTVSALYWAAYPLTLEEYNKENIEYTIGNGGSTGGYTKEDEERDNAIDDALYGKDSFWSF